MTVGITKKMDFLVKYEIKNTGDFLWITVYTIQNTDTILFE